MFCAEPVCFVLSRCVLCCSFSLLNRCVPNYLEIDTDEMMNTATKVIQAINGDDFARKVLADLYDTWQEMLVLCGISLGEYRVGWCWGCGRLGEGFWPN